MNRYFLKHEVLGLRAFTAACVQTPYGTPGDTFTLWLLPKPAVGGREKSWDGSTFT